MENKVVAIHQPNFYPWLGYFNKISNCDIFIILDNVQYQKGKSAKNISNRVKIIINKEPHWLTVPLVQNYSGTRTYQEMELIPQESWRKQITKTIELNYKKAPFFDEIFPIVANSLLMPTNNLAEFNLAGIMAIMNLLDMKSSKIIKSSSLNISENSTQRLIALIEAVGGKTYLSGRGGGKYQDENLFKEAGITLVYNDFLHPEYPQFSNEKFIPGLSIIDALMNCGIQGTKKLFDK